MKEFIRKIRHQIAYWLAHDWIDDLEYRFSAFLCEQTGGMLSKTNYSLQTMVRYADDYQERFCEDCEYRKYMEALEET